MASRNFNQKNHISIFLFSFLIIGALNKENPHRIPVFLEFNTLILSKELLEIIYMMYLFALVKLIKIWGK